MPILESLRTYLGNNDRSPEYIEMVLKKVLQLLEFKEEEEYDVTRDTRFVINQKLQSAISAVYNLITGDTLDFVRNLFNDVNIVTPRSKQSF